MSGKRNLFGVVGILALLCWFGSAYGQTPDDYTTWQNHMPLPLNTTSTGAGQAPGATWTAPVWVTKFPVLVQLTKSNFNGWSKLNYSGNEPIDLRFSKGSDITKHLPYQVDFSSPTHDTLAVWVLADSIWGNDNAHSITMHFGKSSGVYDSSSGKAVFDTTVATGGGFQGVWHLGDTLDATVNNYYGTVLSGPLKDTLGIIGHARGFNGTSQYITFGATTTASKISSSTIKYGGPWTLSAWVYLKSGTTGERDFVGTGDHAYQIQTTGSNWEMDDFSTQFERFDGPTVTTGQWHHVYAVRAHAGTQTHAMPGDSFYVDGAAAITSDNAFSNGNTRDNGHAFTIGAKGEGGSGYLAGYLDEVEMSTVARIKPWAFLSYQNQKGIGSGQTLLAFAIPSSAPTLSAPLNNSGVPSTSPTLSWTSSPSNNGAATYELQVSTVSTFTTTLTDQVGVTGLSYGLSGIASGTTFYWRVNASNFVGTTAWTGTYSFFTPTTWGGQVQLAAPANLATTVATSLTVSWFPMNTALSYNLQVSTDVNFGSTIISQTGITSGTLWPVGGLSNYQTYYWQVQASQAFDGSNPTAWSGASFTTIIKTPTLSLPTNNAQNQPLSLSLNWGSVVGATSYTLQVSTSSVFATTFMSQSGNTTGMMANSLARATTYYWQVNATGNGATTAWSPLQSFMTIPLLPGQPGLRMPLNGANTIPLAPNLAWGSSAGGSVDYYELQLATISDFTTTVLDQNNIAATSLAVGPLVGGALSLYNTPYYWRVNATNINGGTGTWSPVNTFTTTENYASGAWQYHKAFPLTTAASGGANVANTVTKFPVLLRLNPSNFADFTKTKYQAGPPRGAADIRFSRTGNYANSFPYQIDYWSPTNDTALIWVLVDTVFGNADQVNSPNQSITMHYGNSGVSGGLSNGLQVFDTSNGYKGVWHLADSLDATADVYNGSSTTGSSTDAVGIIGHCRQFNGTSSYMQIGTTATKISSVNMPFGGPWTLSAWVNFSGTTAQQSAICGAGDAAYQIQRNNNFDWSVADFTPGPGYCEETGVYPPIGSWHHVVGTRNNTIAYPYAESLFIDGALVNSTVGINSNGSARNVAPFCIGRQGDASGHFLPGYIDEVEVATVCRSTDWVALTYANQQTANSNLTLVSYALLPPVVQLFQPSTNSNGQSPTLTLSWNTASRATAYEVQVSTDASFGTTVSDQSVTTGLSTVPNGLGYGIAYYWRVNSSNGGGTQAWSSIWNFTTLYPAGSPPPLTTPTNGAVNQPTALTLNWYLVANAASYTVQVSTDIGFGTTVVSQGGITSGGALPVTGLSNNTLYYWEVNEFDGSNTSSWSTPQNFTTIIGSPVLSTPTNTAQNQPLSLTLNWQSVSGALSYSVQVSTSSVFATTVLSQAGITTGPSQPVSGLLRSITYYWQVKAIGSIATTTSPLWSFSTIPPVAGAPGLSTPANGANTIPRSCNFSWGTVTGTGPLSYELQVSTITDFSTTFFDQSSGTATSQFAGPFNFSGIYYWRVSANNPGGPSWSSVRTFTATEDYSTLGGWSNHKAIPLSTAVIGGANVANTVTNFPVLLRLNPSNFLNFTLMKYQAGPPRGAADIRFSRTADYTNSFPYQIEYWSPTNDTAAIWVLVDTVFGNADPRSVTQSFTMHYGNNSASSLSNGNAVFDTANGYRGVWHMADSLDATADGYNGTVGTTNLSTNATGMIGQARAFNGTSQFMQVGTTASKIAAGVMPYGGPWTLSAWVYFTNGTTGPQAAICGAGDAAYQIQRNNNHLWGVTDYIAGSNSAQQQGYYEVVGSAPTQGVWHHVAAIRSKVGSPPYAESLFVDGAFISATSGTNTNNGARNATAFCIGAIANSGGHYLGGSIDEVEAAGVARTTDWVTLSYANQQPIASQTLVALGTLPAVPVLSTPTNNAVNQFPTLSLNWGAASGASTYELQVSTTSTFTSTVSDQSGFANYYNFPTGLIYNKTYYWRANSTNATGTSYWSSVSTFTTVIAPPAASPVLSSPTNNAPNQQLSLNLSWGTVSAATSYGVQISTDVNFGSTVSDQSVTLPTAGVSSLLTQTVYYWHAKATNIGGSSSWSDPYSFTTVPPIPGIPGLVTPGNTTGGQGLTPTLSWSTVALAASYGLQVAVVSDFSTTVYSVTSLSTNSQVVPGLHTLMTYYWRANATNAGGTGTWSPGWTFSTLGHFSVPYPSTGPSMSLLIRNSIGPTIDGNLLQKGDEIAAFNHAGLCVGAISWNQADTAFTIWGDNTQTVPIDGMSDNEVVKYRIWSTSLEKEVVAIPTYVTPGTDPATSDSIYVTGGIAVFASLSGISVPAVPVLATPTNFTVNLPVTPTLTWGSVSTATSYRLLVATTTDFTTTVFSQGNLTTTSQTLGTLSNAATYFWKVGAKNAGGTSGWAGTWNFTTVLATPVLAMPTNGTVNQTLPPSLSWGSVNTATSYGVQVSTDSYFASTVNMQTGLTGGITTTVSGLFNSMTYYWRANATNGNGTCDWSLPQSFTTIIATPVLALPTNGAVNQPVALNVSWGSMATANSYHLQVSTISDFTTTIFSQGGLSTTSQSLNSLSLSNATTYFWRVGARDVNGTSGWAGAWNFTTTLATPVLAMPTNGTVNQTLPPSLSWGSVNTATSYGVQVSTDSYFASTVNMQTGLTAGLSTTVGGLFNSMTYYWRANATNGNGTCDWSLPQSFTTIIATPVLALPSNGIAGQSINPILSWGSVAAANSYHLDVATTTDFTTTVYSQGNLTGTSQALNSLTNLTTYFWRVGAKNNGGTSGWAGTWNFTTIIAAPAVPVLASPSNGVAGQSLTPTLSWGSVATANSYHLDVATTTDFTTTIFSQGNLTGTSQSLNGLTNLTTYFWRVGAKNNGGTSGWAGTWNFTTIIGAPAVPILASPSNGVAGQSLTPTLSWGSVATANSYHLDVATTTDFTTTVYSQGNLTGTSQDLSGLTNLTTYFWRVGAKNNGGTSGWAGTWNFTTIHSAPAVPVLASPSNGVAGQSINPILSWGSVATAASYHLDVSTLSDFSTTVYSQGSLTGTSQALINLTNLTTYFWRVGAKNDGGTSGWAGTWNFTTIIGAPAVPVLASPSNGVVGQSLTPTLSWGSVATANSYHLDVATTTDFTTTIFSQGNLTGTSQDLNGLTNLTTYFWRVGAKNDGGTSGWAGTWNFTTIIGAPAVPVLASPSNGVAGQSLTPTLSWGSVAAANSYHLDVATTTDFTTTVYSQGNLTGTSQALNSLTNLTTYFWRVGAKNNGGTSGWAGTWNFTTIIAAPAVPVLASPSNGVAGQSLTPTLSWGSVATANSYHLDVATTTDFTTTIFSQGNLTGTSQSLNGLTNLTTYFWRVGAKNNGGTSGWAGTWNFTTIIGAPAVPILASPSNGVAGQSLTPTLSWGSVATANSYHLDVATTTDFTTTVYSQGNLTGTSQDLSGLTNLTTYFWRVGAKNNGGTSGWAGTWNFTTIHSAPAVPVLASPSNGVAGQSINPILSWGSVATAASYHLDVSTLSDFSTTVYSQGSLTGTSQALINLTNLTTYFWRVGAKNDGGTSGWAGTWNFTTIIAAPAMPVLASPSNGVAGQSLTPTLSWGSVATANSYHLDVATTTDFTTTIFSQGNLTGTSQDLSGLTNLTTYFWRVGAKNNGGTSGWAGTWNFTTIIGAPAVPVLASPSNGVAGQSLTPTLSWGSVAAANSYHLDVATTTDFTTTVYSQGNLTGTSQALNSLTNLTTYFWRVGAKNNGGTSGWAGTWNFTTIIAAPAVPVLASPSNGVAGQSLTPTLSWGSVAAANSYHLDVATTTDFTTTVYSQGNLTGTSQALNSLTNLTTYFWRVGAKNNGGTSGWAGTWNFTTIIAAPAVPVLASPSNGVAGQSLTPTLSWGSVAAANSYHLDVATTTDFTTTIFSQGNLTGTSQSLNGLTNLTTYFWRVGAKNNGGTSGWAGTWNFTTIIGAPAVPVLASPSNGVVGQSLTPTLSWGSVATANSYHLDVATTTDFTTTIFSQGNLTGTSQDLNGLTNLTTYFWRVGAKNDGGTSGWAGTWNFTTIIGAPAVPVLASPSNGVAGQSLTPTLSWGSVAAANSYHLDVATTTDFTTTVYSQGNLTGTSQALNSLTNLTTYFWRVGAKNNGGTSGWAGTWNFTTIIAAPAVPVLASPSNGVAGQSLTPTLSWGSVATANSYHLDVATTTDFTTTIFSQGNLTGTSQSLNGLTNLTTYFWRVGAKNNGGTSGWAGTWNFTTIIGAPAVPILASPSNGVAGQSLTPTLSWGSVATANSYHLDVATTTDFTTTVYSQGNLTGTSQDLSGLTNLTTYFWRVGAKNNGGTSGWAGTWNFTTIHSAPAVPVLASPSNGVAGQSINPILSWGSVATAASYHLDVSTLSDFSTTVYSQGSLTGTSQALINLTNLTTYFWRVGAKNDGGTSGWAGTWNFTTIIGAPAVPVLASPSNGVVGQSLTPTLSWGSVATANSYHLDVATTTDFTTTIFSQGNLTGTSQDLNGLTNLTTYFWRVGAKNDGGTSGWAGTWNFTTIIGAPAVPVLASPSNGVAGQSLTPTLSWGSVAAANSYHLDVATTTDFTTTVYSQGNLTGTSQALNSLTNLTTYFWRVGAKNNGGTSGWAGTWNFTTIIAAPAVPVLASPSNGVAGQSLTPTLSWGSVATANSYHLDVATTTDFTTTIFSQGNLTGTSQSLNGLTNLTTYFWRVGAKNNGGTSGWAGTWNFTTIIGAPAVPILASPSNGVAGQSLTPTLSWGSVATANSYHLDVATTTDFTTTVYSQGNLTGTSQDLSGLTNLTTYFWRVGAKNNGGTSGWAGTWNFTTIHSAPAVPVLASPSNGVAGQSINPILSWGSVATAASYHLDVSTLSDFSTTVYSQGSLTGTSQALINLTNLTTYFWRVGAKNDGGTSGWAGTWNFTTIIAAPAMPVLASPSNGVAGQSLTPTLSWGSVATANSYHLDVATTTDFTTTIFSQGNLTGTSQDLSGLTNLTTYFWRVGAKNNGGTSGWAGTWNFTTIIGAPAVPVLASPSNGVAGQSLTPTLSWGSVAAANSYHLDVATTTDFTTTVYSQGNLTGTSQALNSLTNLTTYFWRVGAKNNGGTSGWAGTWNFTTIIAAPAVPVLASPSNGVAGQSLTPTLSWGSVAAANSYHLDVATTTDFTTTVYSQGNLTGTSQALNSLTNLTTYFWRVGAKNNGGTSGWAGTWNFTTIIAAPAVPVLASPSNGVAGQSLTPTLSWGSVAAANSYHLDVATTTDFTTTIFSQGNLTGTSQSLNGLTNLTTYFWRVGAKNNGGTSGWAGTWNFTTIIGAPAVPVLASPSNGVVGQSLTPTLSWGSVATANSYHLDVATTTDFTTTIFSQGNLTGTSQDLNGLTNLTTYFWRVGAKNDGGTSGWAGTWNFTTIIGAPAVPVLASPSNGVAGQSLTPTLSWGSVAAANSYHLDVATTTDFTTTVYSQGNLTGTSQALNSLTNLTTYFWRVGAKNNGGTSGWAGTWNFTTIIAAPAVPVLASPSNGVAGQSLTPTLSWGSVATANSYHLDVATTTDFTTTIFSQGNLTGTSQSLNGLTNLTTYFWRVGAKNNGGTSGWAGTWNFTTIIGAPAVPILASPSNGVAGQSLTPTLSWGSVATANSYHLDVATTTDFTTTVYSQGNLTGTSQDLSGLTNLTTYFWRVGAKNNGGTSGWAGTWNFTTIHSAPAVPVLASPSNGVAGQSINPILSWGSVATAASYHLDVSTLSDFSTTVYSQGSLTGTSQALINLTNLTTYFWRVGAKNDGGTSGWAGTWNFTTIIGAPAVPVLASPSNGVVGQSLTPTLSWGSVATANSYHLDVATTTDFTTTIFSQGNLTGTSQDLNGLTNLTTYFWRVGAKNDGGTSGWAGTWNFTTIIGAPAVPVLASPSNGVAGQSLTPTLSWGSVAAANSYHLDVATTTDFTTTVYSQGNLTGTSQALNSLTNLTTYFWRVGAKNNGGTSGWAGTWNFTTIIAAPAVPVLASPSNGVAGQSLTPTLSWGSVATANSYHLDVATTTDFTTTIFSQGNLTGTSQSLNGLTNLTTYFWRVGAKNNGGTSGWAGTWNFTTIIGAPAVPILASPSNGVAGQSLTPTLSWGSVATANSYHLDVATTTDFTTTVYSQGNLTGTSQDLSGLTNLTTYFWRVGAKNNGGTSGWAGTWNFTTIHSAPAVPVLASPSNGVAGQSINPILSWGSVATAASYHLDVSTLSDFSTTVYSQGSLTGTSQALINLTNLTTYFWRVGAKNDGGTSGWAGTWNFTTIIAAPAMPVLASPSNGVAGQSLTPTLSWGSVATANSYHLDVATTTDFTTTIFSQGNLTGTSQDLSGLTNLTTYFWRVGAKNNGGTSGWAGTWNFTTIIGAPAVPVLASPSNGVAGQSLTPTLSWGSVAAANSYHLDVATTTDFTTTVYSQGNLTGTSQALNSLTNLTTYFWRVGAKNNGGTSGWAGTWNFTTIIAAPAVPVLASPSNGVAGQSLTPTLSWGSVAAANSYHLDVATTTDFTTTVYSQGNLTGTSQSLNGLTNLTTYFWRVGAKNNGGTSGWAGTWNFTTIIGAPAVPVLASPSNGVAGQSINPILSWGSVATAASYHLDVSTLSDFSTTVYSQGSLTGTSQALINLTNLTTYFWRVGAKNNGGTSGWAGTWNFTTIIGAPAVPVLASPSNGVAGQSINPILSWGSVATANSYHLDVATTTDFTTTVYSQGNLTGTSQNLSNLTNLTTYFWRVGAKNDGGTSGWAGTWNFTTIIGAPAVPVLASPSNGVAGQSLTPTLSWGSVATANSYHLDVATTTDFTTTVFSQGNLTGTSQDLSNLTNLTTYFWRVGAKNNGGTSGWAGTWNFTTIIGAPAVPVLASPSNGVAGQSLTPTLSWGSVATANSYHLDVATTTDFTTTIFSQGNLTGTSQALNGLTNLTTYFWRVGAKNDGGTSGWAGTWNFTTIIGAPAVPVLASPSNGVAGQSLTPTLSWGSVATANSYHLDVATTTDFTTTIFSQGNLTGTSQGLINLGHLTTYFWRVGAKNDGGTSGWAGTWNFTTIIATPDVPQLSLPSNGAVAQPLTLSLSWNSSALASAYSVQVSTDVNFGSTVSQQIGLTTTMATVTGLSNSTTYYWRGMATNVGGSSVWSGAYNFTTFVPFSTPIDAGWNMISINIKPVDSSVAAVFGDAANGQSQHYMKGFILVKSDSGKLYMPTLGIVNDLKSVRVGAGYQLYSDSVDAVKVSGSAIDAFSYQISLLKGWSIIGYLPSSNLPIGTALSGIRSSVMLVKDNNGYIYWPDYGIDNIVNMVVGQGYFTYMKTAATLTYKATLTKSLASADQMLKLPNPRHYGRHSNTGDNASVLATNVLLGDRMAADSCEIAAYDESGNLVGSGTVMQGRTAFAVWGDNVQTKQKDGCKASEKVTFKMWNKSVEYPVEFQAADGAEVRYAAQGIFLGKFVVPEGAMINAFNLAKAYPNPFRGFVRVAFDVPTINGIADHNIEINIFNMKGSLVHQLAKGKYHAGHYLVSWSGESSGNAMVGSSVYVIQMKADNFDKRLKIIKIK